jgi:hypothetical protein
MKRAIVLLAVALAIPTSVAFAKGSPGTHGKSAPMVMYVLKGKLSSYTAATSTTDGSISITVSHSNYHGRALKDKTLPFMVTMKTRITYQNGTTDANISTDKSAWGMVKFRAPKRVTGDLATVLPTMAKAFHVIVNRPAS